MLQDITPHKFDITYRKVIPEKSDMLLIYKNNSVLCSVENEKISFPTISDVKTVFPLLEKKAKFMFKIDDTNFFELRKPELDAFDKWEYISKEKFRALAASWLVFAGITGFQIHDWYTNSQFCGRCGGKTCASEKERAMICEKCGRVLYPQICPCVIVGVRNGESLLVTKYAGKRAGSKYALVAGYAEIGESLEDTVRREVFEEVGLKVRDIEYFASQPWSYTETLLMGFFCSVDGNCDIVMDENELSVAKWVSRDEIPDSSADSTFSLTGTMIKAFKENKI